MTDRNVEFVGAIPAAYDRYLGPMLFEPYAEDLASRIGATPGAVLEIAAGTGILTDRLRRRIPPGSSLTVTDLNHAMLDYARAKLPSAGIVWKVADAQELPFADRSFDTVVCQFGIMFVPDKVRAFREIRRVLRPGGRFLFNVWLSVHDNPLGRIANETIRRFFTSDPPMFYYVPFSYCDEALIRGQLEEADFANVQARRIDLQAMSPSALEAARGLAQGNPVALTIAERATATTDQIVETLRVALAAEGGDTPFRVPMRAMVLTAQAA